jgi:hypothetical protein
VLDVLLVCMPFGPVFSPSIALSLLKGGLKPLGIPVAVRYFSIDFAELVGQDFYMGIARDGRPTVRELAGEWIFSGALFDAAPADEARYVEEILRQRGGWTTRTWARPILPALIDRILRARRRRRTDPTAGRRCFAGSAPATCS